VGETVSGGSWDYVFHHFDDVAGKLDGSDSSLRRALGKRIASIAKALHDIEWVDSCDYNEGDDVESIKAALGPQWREEQLAEVTQHAEAVLAELRSLLGRTGRVGPGSKRIKRDSAAVRRTIAEGAASESSGARAEVKSGTIGSGFKIGNLGRREHEQH
jgi:hypothetical protein